MIAILNKLQLEAVTFLDKLEKSTSYLASYLGSLLTWGRKGEPGIRFSINVAEEKRAWYQVLY